MEKSMKHYLTILFILLFGFICASCTGTSGVKIAEENFTEDCGDKDCTKKNNSKDDFIKDEYLSKEQQEQLAEIQRLHLVDARVQRNNFYGHDYFFRHPAVS